MSSQSPSLQSYPSCQSLPLSPQRYTPGDTTSKALTARQQLKLQRCNKYLPLPKFLSKPELIAPPQEGGLCGGAASAHPPSLQTIPPSTTAATTQRHPAPGPGCLGPCCQEGLAQGANLPLTSLFWGRVGITTPSPSCRVTQVGLMSACLA